MSPSKNLDHTIFKYLPKMDSITCLCEWRGTVDEYEEHKAEVRKKVRDGKESSKVPAKV